jgi:acyl-CoA dehydrogenase
VSNQVTPGAAVLFDRHLDETHHHFREVARRFVRAEVEPHVVAWEEAEEFPRELYRKAAAAGLLGATFPERYGGGGGDLLHAVVMTEEIVAGGSTGVAAGLGSLAIALPPILTLGTDEQRARLVPPVLRGEQVACLAVTEPGGGSDVAAIRTRAVRDGDGYVLAGGKTFITSGGKADLAVVLARTGPDAHGGLTFFAVPTATPGYRVGRLLKKTGWRASDTAEIFFDEVRVPLETRLGEEGSGFVAAMQNFEAERLLLAVQGHAAAMVAVDDATAWAREREAFGRPLVGFQVTRHKLARMSMLTTVARAFNYHLAAALRDGAHLVAECAMAKNFSAEVAQEVLYEAVQLFGGMGYMRETRVERLSRDVRLLPIGGGTTEVMNEIIAKLMGLGR